MIQIRSRLTKLRSRATDSHAKVTSPMHFLDSLQGTLILFFLQKAFPKFADPPPFATFDIGQKVAIIEGSRLVIRARVNGTPDPVVSWTLPNGSTPKERRGRIYVKKSGTLVVKRIQLADQGRYTATATNSVGEVTEVSRVIVIPK